VHEHYFNVLKLIVYTYVQSDEEWNPKFFGALG